MSKSNQIEHEPVAIEYVANPKEHAADKPIFTTEFLGRFVGLEPFQIDMPVDLNPDIITNLIIRTICKAECLITSSISDRMVILASQKVFHTMRHDGPIYEDAYGHGRFSVITPRSGIRSYKVLEVPVDGWFFSVSFLYDFSMHEPFSFNYCYSNEVMPWPR